MARFSTNNTALAAFLATSDVKLLKLDTSVRPATFTFESRNGTIDKLIFQWDAGLAEGNIVSFYKAYKSFVNQIRG